MFAGSRFPGRLRASVANSPPLERKSGVVKGRRRFFADERICVEDVCGHRLKAVNYIDTRGATETKPRTPVSIYQGRACWTDPRQCAYRPPRAASYCRQRKTVCYRSNKHAENRRNVRVSKMKEEQQNPFANKQTKFN